MEFFRQKADGGRGKREQAKVTEERPEKRAKARISPPEMNTIHDSLHPHAPRMVKTGQQASLCLTQNKTNADSDEGNQCSGLIVISVPGWCDQSSERSDAGFCIL